MRITVAGHLEKISGVQGSMVYSTTRNGRVIASARPGKRRQPTTDQRLVQIFGMRSVDAWNALSNVQRDAWLRYAREHFPDNSQGRPTFSRSGQPLYRKAGF